METIVIGGRQTGKTTELIKISAEQNAPIIVLDHIQKGPTMQLAKKIGIEIPDPILINDIINCTSRHDIRVSTLQNVVMDDTIEILQTLIPNNIIAASINTGGGVVEKKNIINLGKSNDTE